MKRVTLSEPAATKMAKPSAKNWLNDAYMLDMDYFVNNLSGIKAKGVRPDVVGSIIAHYASKWVPELSDSKEIAESEGKHSTIPKESATLAWKKKRFFVEALVGILPMENDALPCNFLLRLLRVANKVGVERTYREELEKRVSWQLHQASLKEVMIPSFSHTCGTLLDVGLVKRLVKRFMGLDEGIRSGVTLLKVARLVDSYLVEAAMDSNLSLEEFVELAGALPPHARASDDGLYHAIDTYLKAHPRVTKQEKKHLCKLINPRKLSPEASQHASQNDRLPVRAVIQVLFSEQNKTNRQPDWTGPKGPSTHGLDLPARCLSKREVSAQQMELKRLQEDVLNLQHQITTLQNQLERAVDKKAGFFRWGKFTLMSGFRGGSESRRRDGVGERELWEVGFGRYTPTQGDHDAKTKLLKGNSLPMKLRRSSMS